MVSFHFYMRSSHPTHFAEEGTSHYGVTDIKNKKLNRR